MGKTIDDFSPWSGPFLTTDWVLVYRATLPSGTRDAKVNLGQFATLTGTQTLTGKTLTSPTISGGTINSAPIGGTAPAAGAFTTLSASGAAAFAAALTVGTTLGVTGVITPTGGIAAAAGFAVPTVYHSGGLQPDSATVGTDTTPSVTETYIAEVFVPANCTLTGVSVLNGSAVAGNIQISLANSSGVPIAAAVTVSTAASGTAAYQKVPFAVAYAAKGPAKYFILLQCNNTGYRFRSHIVGNFGASKKTGEVYGTFTTVTPPTTFTTGLAPIADTY